jgi:hypothetical protein
LVARVIPVGCAIIDPLAEEGVKLFRAAEILQGELRGVETAGEDRVPSGLGLRHPGHR